MTRWLYEERMMEHTQKLIKNQIIEYVPNADYVELTGCGHFPSLEQRHNYLKLIYA